MHFEVVSEVVRSESSDEDVQEDEPKGKSAKGAPESCIPLPVPFHTKRNKPNALTETLKKEDHHFEKETMKTF